MSPGFHHRLVSGTRNRRSARDHDPEVLDLAAVFRRGADVLAPFPTGLVGRPAQRHAADLDQLEPPERELPHLVGLLEPAQQELVERHVPPAYGAP